MTEQTDAAEVEALRADLANAECACGHQAEWHSALLGCNAEDWDQPACDCRGDWLDAVLPLIAAREAAARAEERERVAAAIEAEADRAHAAFASDEDDHLADMRNRLGVTLEPGHWNRHDDGCGMCGMASAARIARTDGAGS